MSASATQGGHNEPLKDHRLDVSRTAIVQVRRGGYFRQNARTGETPQTGKNALIDSMSDDELAVKDAQHARP